MKRMCERSAGRLAASREAWTWERVGGGGGGGVWPRTNTNTK